MKIRLYGINFAPELTGIGKYTGELAAWLAARGHQVRVVTAPPYYPAWAVSPGYNGSAYRTEQWQVVTVVRCPLWVPRQPGGAKRLLHLASFALSSLPVLLAQVLWRPKLVWVVEPALFCAPAAVAVARLAVNWVDMAQFALPSPNGVAAYRAELNIPAGAVVALYSGNMGGKQGLEVLAEAAKLSAAVPNATEGFWEAKRSAQVKEERPRGAGDTEQNASPPRSLTPSPVSPQVVFVLCGNGAGRADLVARCQGLTNVRFLDLQPAERLPDLLATADIHLLPQRADAADLVMPSKLTGMLASARAVVATAHTGTELANVVQTCGLVVPPEDPAALAQAIHTLALDAALRERLGAAGFAYTQAHLDREAVLQRFEADVEQLICSMPPI
jgi:colanic acid biosynthesis glycosyl transferase WcaI